MSDIAFSATMDHAQVERAFSIMAGKGKSFADGAVREFSRIKKAQQSFEQSSTRGSGAVRGGAMGSRNASYIAGQAAMQAQDVAVQLQMGARMSTVIAQQGSQLLSLFGPGGMILGGVLAVGAAIVGWALGTDKADEEAKQLDKTMKSLEESTRNSLKNITDIKDQIRIERASPDVAEGLEIGSQRRQKLDALREELAKLDANKPVPKPMAGTSWKDVLTSDWEGGSQAAENKKIQEENQRALDAYTESRKRKEEEIHQTVLLYSNRQDKLEKDLNAKSWEARRKFEEDAFALHERYESEKAASLKKQQDWEMQSFEKQQKEKEASLKAQEDWQVRMFKDQEQRTKGFEKLAELLDEEKANANASIAAMATQKFNQLHTATFGKTQQQIRSEAKEVAKAERAEAKWEKKMEKTGGLVDVKRNMAGEIIDGFDPLTQKRMSGEEAKARFAALQAGKAIHGNEKNIIMSKESVTDLVAAIEKLLPK